jgi:2-polyprenyl-3-methyl-5-hydroxy-6-metoxy-1,4-benzoquinol methylase
MPFARQVRSGRTDHETRNSPRGAVRSTDLARLLRSNIPATGFIDRLKIGFRPYICPFDLLLPYIEPSLRYFDIGCGSGMFLRILAEYKCPLALGGVEISPRLIENARSVLATSDVPKALQVYDGCSLPAEVGDYDYLFMIDVLHHMPIDRQFTFLTALGNEMRPGQRLLFKDIDAASLLVYWNKLHDLALAGEIVHEQRAERVREHLESVGFQVDILFRKRVYLYPHYALLCTKPEPQGSSTQLF